MRFDNLSLLYLPETKRWGFQVHLVWINKIEKELQEQINWQLKSAIDSTAVLWTARP